MSSSVCDEELSSIASLSPLLSPKSGTLELPHSSDAIKVEVITTPEPTIEIKPSSSNTSIINSIQPTFSSLKTRHSPTPPPNNLQITIDNATFTVLTKILVEPVFIESGILPPILNPQKNTSQSNTLPDEFLRTHPHFKASLPSFYTIPTTYKYRFPKIETLITMLHMPPKILNYSSSGKINVFLSSNSNLISSNLHSMILTLMPPILPLLLLSKNFTTKPINFFLNKGTPKFSDFKIRNSPLHSRTILTIF